MEFCCKLYSIFASPLVTYTVGHLYKGHMGPGNLSTVEKLSTLQRWKGISTIGESVFGVLESVLCREVVYIIVSFIGRVLSFNSSLFSCSPWHSRTQN